MFSIMDRLKRRRWQWLAVLAGLMLLTSCGKEGARSGGTVSVITPDFFGIGEDLSSQLNVNLRRSLGDKKRLIMSTFVNIDNLYQTSGFGRTLTEAMSTSLFRRGFGVVEIRKSPQLLIKSASGELILTRDATLIANQYEAEAILAGTYSLTPNSVIVNVKLLDAASHAVLSVAGIEIQRSQNINYLLSGSSGSVDAELSAYER